MNALLLCFGVGWIGLTFGIEAAQIWNIFQAASTFQEGWSRVNEAFGPYNYPQMLFEPLIFTPGLAALAWRQSRIGKAAKSMIHAQASPRHEPAPQVSR